MTDSDFLSLLKNLQDYSIQRFEIANYNASSISTDVWKGQNIDTLVLNHVEVEDASFRRGKRHFQGLENSLETLDVRESFRNIHRPLLNLQLDHLNKLKVCMQE